jgi:HEPN domain-containing protein
VKAMQELNVTTLKSEAEKYLKIAQDEMFKAKEDVVPYMICKNARLSMSHFLKGFLIRKGESIEENTPITELIEKCKLYNNKFSVLEAREMACGKQAGAEAYCTSMDKVGGCVEAAIEAKNLTAADHWPLSKPVK